MPSLDISLIADLPPFIGMEKRDLSDFLSKARSARYPKESQIFGQAEKAEAFFFLLDGYIRVVRITPHGDQVIARYISSGELFGIAQAIGRDTYPANAIAAVDCVTLSWPGSLWQEIVTKYPTFATNASSVIGGRLQDAQDRLVELATERVEQRVANAILKLANQAGKRTADGILIDFPISRQDISEMTGTTLHTVSRLLSSWEQDGLVKSGRKKITITEGHRLLLIAEGMQKNRDG
ncbi:Crp/Fnr family transcriptional regulator [Sneathiella sp.]|uniref:Crp/Fnr family transcriptional regulator n=1 Tax=Sneathiella sp. TaxID=1964365 RepID=UPI003564CC6C